MCRREINVHFRVHQFRGGLYNFTAIEKLRFIKFHKQIAFFLNQMYLSEGIEQSLYKQSAVFGYSVFIFLKPEIYNFLPNLLAEWTLPKVIFVSSNSRCGERRQNGRTDFQRYSMCTICRHLFSAICMGTWTMLKALLALLYLLVDVISSDRHNLWRKIMKTRHKV